MSEASKTQKRTKTPTTTQQPARSGDTGSLSKRVLPSSFARFEDQTSRDEKASTAYRRMIRGRHHMNGVRALALERVNLIAGCLNQKPKSKKKATSSDGAVADGSKKKRVGVSSKFKSGIRKTKTFKELLGNFATAGTADFLVNATMKLYVDNLIANNIYPVVSVTKPRKGNTRKVSLTFYRNVKTSHKSRSSTDNAATVGMYDGSGMDAAERNMPRFSIQNTIKPKHMGAAMNGNNLFAQICNKSVANCYDKSGIMFPTHTKATLIAGQKNRK